MRHSLIYSQKKDTKVASNGLGDAANSQDRPSEAFVPRRLSPINKKKLYPEVDHATIAIYN